ncbi:MAG TPA: efflux RND transporter permease subunit [Streptosporangiaceae bacterium]|nr:efflux RND transporter permease subunit [Streptosporangiaceae bacterium]
MRIHAIFGGIGAFAVKFRWVVIAAWVIAAIAVPRFLPSLASVTQGNNSAFLPASAPSEQAAQLAAPFGTTNLIPVPVVAAVSQGTLSTADEAWLTTLQHDLGTVPTVSAVKDLGRSADGQAAQLLVLSDVNGGNAPAQTTLIDDLRAEIARAAPPAGMQVHLAGDIAINVDQQAKSGTTGNQIEFVSVIFILVLLLLIFRALLAPLITLIPAFFAVAISGPLVGEAAHAGLKVSQLAQLMLIVLVLGAGTDYGLFLVFRVRENLRGGEEPKEAVRAAVTRVGETITFSALTVIAALLSLLVATFQIYSQLGIPLAIGIGTMLLAGLTLLPALLAVFGRAVFWPSKTREGTGKAGLWGRIATRIVRRPAVPLTIGVLGLGALALAVTAYSPGGFGGAVTAPTGSDSAAGTALLAKHFPSSSSNPTNLIYKLPQPAWENPEPIATATGQLEASGLFTGVTGPLSPAGVTLTPAQYTSLHSLLGNAATLPAVPTTHLTIPLQAYEVYRATAQYVSPDGMTIQFQTGLKAGDPSTTAAMNAVPSVRAEAAAAAKTLGATEWGVGGEAPAFYDISQISDSDLTRVVPVAIVVIGLLLCLVIRSLIAPIYLIASVALSFFAALGLSVIIFMKIGGDSGLTFILPFLMFIFLLALGEDYNILVMSRIREEAHHFPLRQAVARAVGATGTTVTSAGLVLAGTFSVFAVIGGRQPGGSQIRDVGIGLALGVLMDTFIVRTVLVPCTVILLGRWNWWPSRLSRRDRQLPGAEGTQRDTEPARAS